MQEMHDTHSAQYKLVKQLIVHTSHHHLVSLLSFFIFYFFSSKLFSVEYFHCKKLLEPASCVTQSTGHIGWQKVYRKNWRHTDTAMVEYNSIVGHYRSYIDHRQVLPTIGNNIVSPIHTPGWSLEQE